MRLYPLDIGPATGDGSKYQQSQILSHPSENETIHERWHYQAYVLLGRSGELATICSATCECAAG